jgi:mRNA-degrading endonuclease RelE of RelBE toxin-antitoxin system
MSFQVLVNKEIRSKIVSLPRAHQEKVGELIDKLGEIPYPSRTRFIALSSTTQPNFDIKKCKRHQTRFRVRFGGYRLVYEIDKTKEQVLILKLDTREDTYD